MIIRHSLRAALLLVTLIAVGANAQQADDEDAPSPPNLNSLQSDWWAYFDGPRTQIAPRVESFLADLETQASDLSAQNLQAARSALSAVRNNFNVYLSLLEEAEFEAEELPAESASYTIAEMLDVAARAREARATANDRQIEVEREERTLAGVERRRDAAFKEYINAAAGDARWLAATRLIQARTAQAISTRRLELLTRSFEQAEAYALALEARVALAEERLATAADPAEVEALRDQVAARRTSVDQRREQVEAAKIAASTLDLDTPLANSEQQLARQKLLGEEVALARAEIGLAQAEAELNWTTLKLEAAEDTDALEEQILGWSELIRRIDEQVPQWQRDIEDELLAVQGTSREGLERDARRLLDRRLDTAQDSLAGIGELDDSVADLELTIQAVDRAMAETTGAIRSWVATTSRELKAVYLRITGIADYTLFSIGETPVTGGDILRVILILAIALLLSRGVRAAIRRVAEGEYTGTQASMYTVGRLTHYAIIIIAGFIALSSIGLDFSNLALVAGALSVGIGFGLQSIVSNFVSGLIILFEHTLRVGDYIELDTGLTGTVKAINVRSTLINTNDNIDIVVPNSEFVSNRLTNWTLGERILRVRIPFGVAYGSDKELVRKAALEAAAEVPYTLTHMKGREPDIWLVEFGDNSLNFLLLVWVNRQGAKRPTRTMAAYLWALETKFQEYGIEIPFPQRDLHLRSGWPAKGGNPAA